MQIHTLNNREIRSFRLRHKTILLKDFFETSSLGFFIMTDTIQPKDHIQLRKEFKTHNLQIQNISKKISIFLTQNNEWRHIKNLLIGNVILIKTTQNIPNTLPNTINFITTNTNFNIRFLVWNKTFYREQVIKNFMQKHHINHLLLLIRLIKKISLTPLLFINPFLLRQQ